MAEPLAPDGFVRLKDAYDTFLFGRIGEAPSLDSGYGAEHSAYANQSDVANRIFVQALDQIAYRGKIVSHDGKLFEVSGDLFDRAGFADLLPLHNAIPKGTSGPLANYVGGIICLNGQVFFEWLEQHLSTHLHGEIQNGDLTPIAANARLATVKLPALDAMPPVQSFHEAVLKESYWTLPMTVAWIAWRKIDDVVKQFFPYAKQDGHWRESRGPDQATAGWVWQSADEPKLSDLMFFEAAETYYDNAPLKFIKESREELWRALQSGEIIAIGSEGGGSHKKIASERWASLKIQPVLQGHEYVGAGQYGDCEKIHDVKLPSKEVQQIWPVLQVEISKEPTLSICLSRAEIEAAYIARVREWPTGTTSPSANDDHTFLKTLKPDISRERMRELRNKFAPPHWKKNGRKPKTT